jgi:hypothetical protein
MLRAGVVAALAVGALLVAPAPAQANNPTVTITSLSSGTLRMGETATLKYTVTNGPGPDAESIDVNVNVPGDLNCSGQCDHTIALNGGQTSAEFTATLSVKNPPGPGQSKQVTVTIVAGGNQAGAKQRTITLIGPEAPQTVKDVTVKVFNSGTGQALPGALLIIEDSAGTQWNVQAASNGQARITSTQSKPIQPGEISVVAGMDGFQNLVKTGQGRAGQSLVIEMRLVSSASPTPTAEPTTAGPTEELSSTQTEEAINPVAGNDDGGGGLSWMLIVMGGLLVALGIGAIVLLLLRRRDDGEEGEVVEGPAYSGPRGPAPLPAGRSAYRGGPPPALAGPPADRTMITRQPMDAPTMMHRPADYGAPGPRPPQPGYGPPTPPPGYGQPPYPTSPSPTYGTPAYPSAPASPAGYGPPPPAPRSADPYRGADYGDRGYAGGYGVAEPRQYDDGYGQATSNYGAAPAGYGPPQGYDQGYAPPPPPSYDSGYGQAGYDQGYDPRGYDRAPEQRNGYEPQGYDAGGGHYDEPTTRRPAPQSRSERRSLDWLDD